MFGIRAWSLGSKEQLLAKSEKEVEKADPYVIAYAEILGYKAITQESRDGAANMVAACIDRKVICGNLLDYLEDRKNALNDIRRLLFAPRP